MKGRRARPDRPRFLGQGGWKLSELPVAQQFLIK